MKSYRDKKFKEYAEKYNLDRRVVQAIADYVIKFTAKSIADDNDTRPIRIRHLCSFVPKDSYLKKLQDNQPASE